VSIGAIIAAAGQGTRAGSSPVRKQFLNIQHKPVLVHTLEKFCQSPVVDSIVIVVPAGYKNYVAEQVVEKFSLSKIAHIVAGGATRQQSVYQGLEALEPAVTTVVVHDAVRPFISASLLNRVIDRGQKTGAAVVAIPVDDTIKQVSGDRIERTLSRESLWLVQTPQVFRRDVIVHAYQWAFFNGIVATDDSELVERWGYPVHIVPGKRSNIKITTVEDLELAKMLIQKLG